MDIVKDHLAAGGERAPEPPPGYYPVIPHQCPVCHAQVRYAPELSSKRRGAGWRCDVGGSAHYWQRMGQALRDKVSANPWLFPPVVVREGKQIAVFDGVLPGDQVLYAGVLRSEVWSAA